MIKSNFISVIVLCLFFSTNAFSQSVLTGLEAHQKLSGTQTLYYSNSNQIPSYIKFQKGKSLNRDFAIAWYQKAFDLSTFKFLYKSELTDKLGQIHYKYEIEYNGVLIENTVLTLHSVNDKIVSISGNVNKETVNSVSPSISEANALNYALTYVGATQYKWEIPVEESHIKIETNNPLATYYPEGQKVLLPSFYHGKEQYLLAYKFNIYAQTPISRSYIYVDALNGDILAEDKIIKHVDAVGSATTAYSGVRAITTDDNAGTYRLRESGRGNGIETYDMGQGTAYGSAVDFTDADNIWNNVNANLDEYATDAHWGAEMTYDYFWLEHGRNSIDGFGFLLKSYIHYDNNYVNAFWDGQRMTYGDGDAFNTPLTTIDICGHEVSHGLTSNTAGLIYNAESGALNESFSDIFGTCIENFGRPSNWNWTIGEDIGGSFRDMSNPNSNGDPDTYFGTNWAPLTGGDNGGVHTNSGVQNFWFYLLTTGGSGTNDNGDAYTVNVQGFTKASSIAFRNLTVYLTPSSNFNDARFYAILSAIDLYGVCTPEVEATTNAWYAVGVGNVYNPNVIADFMAMDTLFCSYPSIVNFQNLSNNAYIFKWYFGDSDSSSIDNPNHLYASNGSYDVTLIADGGTCGIDTIVLNNYIQIDTTIACVIEMPTSGQGNIQTSCTGTLFDSGGANNNYGDDQDATLTIAPLGADSVQINFISFSIEAGTGTSCNYDYLNIYDGANTSANLIGSYCDNNIPSIITSTGGAITLEFHSDVNVNESGFEIDWICFTSVIPPVPNFTSNDTISCSGIVNFQDLTTGGPTLWDWSFGDNSTSSLQNPTHTYTLSGLYTVKLVVSNINGIDSIEYINYVDIDLLNPPTPLNDTICANQTADFFATGLAINRWYDNQIGGNLLYEGNNFTSAILPNTTDYFVSNFQPGSSFITGAPSSAIGAGGYFNGEQGLIFNSNINCILKSVDVVANGGGNRTIELRDATGSILSSETVFIADGYQTVILNMEIPIGLDLELGTAMGSAPNLYRNNAGTSYPYADPTGHVEIINSSAGNGFYYFYYNWQLEEVGCESNRVLTQAIVYPDFNLVMNLPEYTCVYTNSTQLTSNVSGGTWTANCTNCIDVNTGVFSPSNAGEGIWTITYTANNNCEKTIIDSIEVRSCLSVENEKGNSFQIYPNPSNNIINIKTSNNSNILIQMNDISGKLVFESKMINETTSFNITQFESGIYFIKFINQEGVLIETKKFIKQ